MSRTINTKNNFSNLDERRFIEENVQGCLSPFKESEDSRSKDCLNDQSIAQLIKKANEMGVPLEFVDFIVNEFVKKNEQLNETIQQRDNLKKENKVLKNSFRTLNRKFKKVRNLSETDPLTGIYNRRGVLKRLNKEIKNAHRSENPLVLLLIDGDNFKSYNDNFNYEVGDQVLKHIVNTSESQIRPNDIIGRLGGEEFIVVLPQTKLEDALKIAERIRKSINTEFTCNFKGQDQILKPSVSIGVASKIIINPVKANDKAEIIGNEIIGEANTTLKEAKATGKNKIFIVK